MFLAVSHCFLHDQGITGVKAASDIGMVDER
jgi:hypothetical protein